METPLLVFRLWSTGATFSQHLLLLLLCGSDFEARRKKVSAGLQVDVLDGKLSQTNGFNKRIPRISWIS